MQGVRGRRSEEVGFNRSKDNSKAGWAVKRANQNRDENTT
jgi:hypothetical protein